MSRGGLERGSLDISFDGLTSTESRTQKSAPTPDEGDGGGGGDEEEADGGDGVIRKAGKGYLPADDPGEDDDSLTAQEVREKYVYSDDEDRRTAQDLLEERDEAYKEAMGRAASPFGGDEKVVKESDDLEMPSFDLEAAEKSDDEKTAERIGEEIAKRMDLSASESRPSDGEGVSFARLFEGKSEKASRVAKGVEEYIRDGGSLSDPLDEVQRWAGGGA